MGKLLMRRTAALALAGALSLSAMGPSFASPLPTAVAAVGQAKNNQIIDVRWHGRGYGYGHGYWAGGVAAGLIAGGLIGAAAAPYYYGDPYSYGPPPYPVYGPPPPVYYAPPPVVYEPPPAANGPNRQCWVATDKDRGFGYWRPC
jgi:hypothetical protein